MEQMGLQDGAPVDGAAVLDGDQVELGEPPALAPDVAADAGAHEAGPHVEHRGTQAHPHQAGHRQWLDEVVSELAAPHEGAEQGPFACAEDTDDQPLDQDGDE